MVRSLLMAVLCSGLLAGCGNDDIPNLGVGMTEETYYANVFAKDVLETYYYWNKEIASDLERLNPETNTDPIKTVEDIRFHEGDIEDRWTMLTDDLESFNSNIEGVYTTYGYSLSFYYLDDTSNRVMAAVAYVYDDSPAWKAGLKRGDVISQINGEQLTDENYQSLYYSSTVTVSLAMVDEDFNILPTGKQISLTAVEMYENPIICHKIFDVNGRKIAYLAYDSFDTASIPRLIEIAKDFKAQQVKELILDLRYNGGGYALTEEVLASIFAPQSVVDSRAVLNYEDYNDILDRNGWSTETRFSTEFKNETLGIDVSTKDANLNLDKIYVLMGPNTASASEALVGDLLPYMEIELIGQQTHGKYCSGVILSPNDIYKKKAPAAIGRWGMYVMIGIYKNCMGNTPSMPSGLIPDMEVKDMPFLPAQLGDEDEVMLHAALESAGLGSAETIRARCVPCSLQTLPGYRKKNFGRRILSSIY